MINSFYNYLNGLISIDRSIMGMIEPYCERKSLKKGSVLLKVGEIPDCMYFIDEGVVRGYYTQKKGKEYNRALFSEGGIATSFVALMEKEPSTMTLECLTDCELIAMDYDNIVNLGHKDPIIFELHIKILETYFIIREQEIIELATLDAKDRYLELRKRIPGIDNLISQFHIASHLGITPIQLSRVRKKLLEEDYLN